MTSYKGIYLNRKSVKIAFSGASGQIAYSPFFRLANGDLLGPDQPVSS